MARSGHSAAPYTQSQPWAAHYDPLPPLYQAKRSSDEVHGRSPPTPEASTTPSREVGGAVLRHRKTPVVLFILYFILLIVPWILTCVLVDRPFTTSKYHDQRGRLSPNNWLFSWSLVAFIRVLRSLSSIITIPITTTILAYAAVTFAQNRYPGQKLSVAQLLALSDRGWTDVTVLWHSHRAGRSSSLLWLGAGLVLLETKATVEAGVVQQAVQAAFAGTELISVVSCIDIPYGPCRTQAHKVGYDTDPWAMALVDHRVITQDVANSLATLNGIENQHNLWVDNPHSYGEDQLIQWDDPTQLTKLSLYGYRDNGEKMSPGAGYFVSSLPNGTTTGVLREHAMRLNSTVSCQNISRSDFPETCPGERPVEARVQRLWSNISICAPGEIGKHPWTLSRSRQITKEELFIDFQAVGNLDFMDTLGQGNYTMHCKASTSRDYFELGNAMNDWVYGPLLEEWPDEETIENETNNYIDYGKRPTEFDDPWDGAEGMPFGPWVMDPWDVGPLPVSGPLMMAANALFGNVSFLQPLRENATTLDLIETLETICTSATVPFLQLVGGDYHADWARYVCRGQALQREEDEEQLTEDTEQDIHQLLTSWMGNFATPEGTSNLLEMSMFLVNRAVMLKTVAGAGSLYARPIFTSPGTFSMKPSMNLATIIAISILILLQSIGLAVAVWYSRRVPTWTATFDSIAVARIGRAMKEDDIPPLGPVSSNDRKKLTKANALVGIVGDDQRNDEPDGHGDGSGGEPGDGDLENGHREHSSSEVVHENIRLGLGGPGRIEKRHAFKKKEKKDKETEDSGDTLP